MNYTPNFQIRQGEKMKNNEIDKNSEKDDNFVYYPPIRMVTRLINEMVAKATAELEEETEEEMKTPDPPLEKVKALYEDTPQSD